MVVVNYLRQKQLGIEEAVCSAFDTYWDGLAISGVKPTHEEVFHSFPSEANSVGFI